MEILEKLFGSVAKVKIIKLFIFNPLSAYDLNDVISRAQVSKESARKELNLLEKIGLIKKRVFSKEVKRKDSEPTKVRTMGWIVEENFPYLFPLQNFLIQVGPIKHHELIKKFGKVGKIKLLITSGVLIQQLESRVDLLVVGDNLRKGTLESVVRTIESEIGKELRYSYFETSDFQYRLGMCDKLIRDILDFPHEKVIDKITPVEN